MLIGPTNPILTNEEIDKPLELISPLPALRFKDCIFKVPPKLPPYPPHGQTSLTFDHCTFRTPLKFAGIYFHRRVTFHECRFEGYADFTRSHFLQGVSFQDCSFDEKVYFEEATFGIDPHEGTSAHESLVSCDVCNASLKEALKESVTSFISSVVVRRK